MARKFGMGFFSWGGTPLFDLYGYVPQNKVWLSGSESLTGYTISLLSVLNCVSFWTGSLSKSVKTCHERSTFAVPIIFSSISISTILV